MPITEGRGGGIGGLCVNQSSICLRVPPVKTGDRSVYFAFCTLWVGLRSSFTTNPHFYYRSRATVSIRYRFECANLVFHDDDGTISRISWSEITFHEFASSTIGRWPLSNEAKPSPKRSSNRGEKLHNRSKAVANLFEYLFEDVETVEIIPCFSRIRVRGSSKAKKQSPSIERRSDPTEDPSIPLNRNPVTRSKTEEILDVNKSDVEANVDLPFGRSHVECYTGAEELLTVQRFYRRIDEQTRHWLIDEAIDSTRFERVTRSRRGICTGTIAISMLALCLLI